jgi:hypothetical protein
MRRILLVMILMGWCGPVSACLNDKESKAHEREFRSQYREDGGDPVESESDRQPMLSPRMAGVTGLTLFAGALTLGYFRQRTR